MKYKGNSVCKATNRLTIEEDFYDRSINYTGTIRISVLTIYGSNIMNILQAIYDKDNVDTKPYIQ